MADTTLVTTTYSALQQQVQFLKENREKLGSGLSFAEAAAGTIAAHFIQGEVARMADWKTWMKYHSEFFPPLRLVLKELKLTNTEIRRLKKKAWKIFKLPQQSKRV